MRPLDGITVVSLEHAIAAPFCTRQLADLGARVIKIERPGVGGFARGYDTRARLRACMKPASLKALGALLLAAVAGCASLPRAQEAAPSEAPGAPRATSDSPRRERPPIYDTAGDAFIGEATLVARLAAARFPLLGEVHDNPAPHAARARLLRELAATGRHPAVVLEQFDLPYDTALVTAQRAGADAEALADAGGLDRRAWQWPLHAPIVTAALDLHLPIHAGNVPLVQLRPLFEHAAVPAEWRALLATARWSGQQETALRDEIRESHCGSLPERLVPGFAAAQRVRDALMARALVADATADGAVLIAGNGHVRHDRGVPVYLPQGQSASVGFVEVDDVPADPLRSARAARAVYDYVWLIPGVARDDPCAALRGPGSPLQAVPPPEETP